MENQTEPDLSGPVSTHTVVVEFTVSGYTAGGAAQRAVGLMYADGPLGSLPRGVVNVRLVAVDGAYLPMAEDLELRHP
jgi:hypothetical protein